VDGLPLCRSHFYDMASKRLEEHRTRLQRMDPVGADRAPILKFLSEIISQTTTLAATAKFLSPSQRDMFLELSLSAIELHERVQRDPRIRRDMPILIYRETASDGKQELTNTVDVSKAGACVATIGLWKTGEKLWIEKPGSQQRALARVAWVKNSEPPQYLMGLELLDSEDFWGLAPGSLKMSRR